MLGAMGSPTVLAAQDIVLDAGVTQLFPLTAAEFTFKLDPAEAAGSAEIQQPAALHRERRGRR